MNIITKNDISELLDISTNLDTSRIEKFAAEQEKIKCTQFLGKALYDELKAADWSDEKWANLMDQVKPMLIYWTYATYLSRGQVFNTATGPVVKRVDQSVPLSDKELQTAINDVCSSARFFESELKKFLQENAAIYPNYKSDAKHTGCKVFSIRKSTNNQGV